MTDLSQVVPHAAGGELRIPLNQIRRNPAIDPRKGRNKSDYAAFVESIRKDGVLQSILIRPISGADVPYEVVAGNTRYDGSNDAGLFDIPAIIREMTDAEARAAAAIENMKRSNLTPIEEARHCEVLLADSANDHEEVCRTLGWTRQRLDSRLLLAKCCDEVAEALVQGQIKIGHAELLAPRAPEDQRDICAKIIDRNMSVADTKQRLLSITADISKARFDTTECTKCPHNSGLYNDMFETTLGGAKCQKHTCWTAKTEQLIQVRLIEAEADYGVVHTDMTLPKDGYVLLEESGANGVGTAQISSCVSCKHYGAVVSTVPGNEGHTVGGHCFDRNCNAERKAAYKALISQASGTALAVQDAGDAPATGPNTATKSTTATATKSPKAEPTKPQEMKRSIRREAFNLFAQMGKVAIKGDRRLVLAISIVSLYLDMRVDLPGELDDLMKKAVGFPAGLASYNRAAFEAELAMLPVEKLDSFLTDLAACTVLRKDTADQFQKSIGGAQSLSVIKSSGMNPVEYFKMTESYLKALTKAGIIADCKASGFELKYDEVKGEKAFSKLAGGKADDLIKAVLEFTEFSWSGYLPDAMKISTHDGSATPVVG